MFRLPIYLGIFFFLSTSVLASPPAGLNWFSLESEHFHVHFTAEQEIYARAITVALERALPKLERDLGWKAPAAIDIVINDAADDANGAAISFPNTHIELFSVPFRSDSVLLDYHNWVQELATHELTHIIANDSAFGAYQTFRSIFGSWVKPNGLQPAWLIEGLAVNEETKQTPGGRGRSVIVDAFFRTASQEKELGTFYTVDRFNDGYDWWWPAGNAPYFFGYAAQAAYSPGKISAENADSLPYSLNGVLERVAGKNWETAWQETSKKMDARYEVPSKPDASNPAFCQLTSSGRFTGGVALGEDALYFTLEDPQEGFALAKLPIKKNCEKIEPEILIKKEYESPPSVSISPDKKQLLFTVADYTKTNLFLDDVFLYDLEKKSSQRLTHEARLFDPSFLPNGKDFIAIRQLPDSTQAIVAYSLQGNFLREIFRAKAFERLGQPSAIGNEIFFSKHDNAGHEELFSLNTEDHSLKALIEGIQKGTRFTERDVFLLNQNELVFVANYPSLTKHSSLATFKYNRKTKKLIKIAESASGVILHPALVGNILYASVYTKQGMNLMKIDSAAQQAISPIPSTTTDLYEDLSGIKPQEEEAEKPVPLSATKPYSAFSSPATSLWPQYWLPMGQITYNGALLGASTSGNDPLNYQNYGLTAYYDTRASFPTYSANYTNRNYLTNFSLGADQYNNYFQSSGASNRVALYSGDITYPIATHLSTSAGAAFQENALFGSTSNNFFLFDYLNYNDIRSTPSAITPNRGIFANLYLGLYPQARAEVAFADFRPSLGLYWEGVQPSHSISLLANFAVSTNKFLATNYYVGGGASVLSNSSYIVRGYPQDTLLGQKIATLNFGYTLPLFRPYSGWNTNPIFFKDIGLRFLLDGGASSYLSRYDSGYNFLYYDAKPFGTEVIFGTGVDLVTETKILYYVPLELSLGLHRGLQTQYGGETILYLGLSIGNLSGTSSILNHH